MYLRNASDTARSATAVNRGDRRKSVVLAILCVFVEVIRAMSSLRSAVLSHCAWMCRYLPEALDPWLLQGLIGLNWSNSALNSINYTV